MIEKPRITVPCTLLALFVAGCAAAPRPKPEPARYSELSPAQAASARAEGEAWMREDAERRRKLEEAERWRRDEEARRAAEAAERARIAEEERQRVAAELAANPYQFEGAFQGGDDECGSAMLFRFADIRGIVRDCAECDCKFRTDRTKDGTAWTAACKGGRAGNVRSRLFVSSEFAQEADDGTKLWRSTFERTVSGKNTCGYVGSMRDRAGNWKAQEADHTTRRTAPTYTVGTGVEAPTPATR